MEPPVDAGGSAFSEMKKLWKTEGTGKPSTGRKAITILLIIVAAFFVFGGKTELGSDNEGELIGINVESEMTAMELSWKPQDNIHYYELSRADITDVLPGEDNVARSEYSKIATIGGNKGTYRDENVKMGHRYAYVVDGYRKSFGHLKKACTSYEDGGTEYNTVGLARPDLFNSGYGEDHSNSKDKIYLYVQSYEGVEPHDAVLYRKSSGDFKKVSYKLLDDSFSSGSTILDDTVKPGVTYTYKVRTSTTYQGETITSTDSEEITIPAVNFTADYHVRAMTDAWDGGDNDDTFIIEVASDIYNGDTLFRSKPSMTYYAKKNKEQKDTFVFDAKLTGWSKSYADEATVWATIPDSGVRLEAGERIYLKYQLSAREETYEENTVTTEELCFCGKVAEESVLKANDDNGGIGAAEYEGSGSGVTYITLDLISGKGSAYCEWD